MGKVGLVMDSNFRSSPWFAVGFVYLAVVVPGTAVVLADSSFSTEARVLATAALVTVTLLIAVAVVRRLRRGRPGRHVA